MTKVRAVIPFRPRYPQKQILREIARHRFIVLVAHRRMGKTVLSVNSIIKRSLKEGKPDGFYAYIAPFRTQAKQIAWAYLKRYTATLPFTKYNESELTVTLFTGAVIRIFGADNPDALRGNYFDGVLFDEVAQMKPEVWGEIVRPALADRGGWAVFIGTPKGVNLFSQLYDKAMKLESEGNPNWKALLYSVDQTHVIDEKELESLREEMSENEYRQEFLCDFNAASDDALISIDLVREAVTRTYAESDYDFAPVVMGVDVARFGNDSSTIWRRQGLVAFPPTVVRKTDNMALADMIAWHYHTYKPQLLHIDAGRGEGVIDRLRQMNIPAIEVPFGSSACRPDRYANRRMEMWATMRDWLKQGGSIPDDPILQADLCAPTYGFNPRGLLILEPKDKIKERLGRSTDLGDGLALTFATPVVTPSRFEKVEVYDPRSAFEDKWRQW